MAQFQFHGDLWEHAGASPGSWHFVTIPGDLAEDIIGEAGQRNAFGSIRVEATIGTTTWRTSLFPDEVRGALLLPVKKQVRSTEDLSDGSPCHVALSIVD
jgi:hypothetical protein